MSLIETLAQVSSTKTPKFTAGIVLWDDVVVEAAPILIYMKRQRWSRTRVRDYCRKKGWQISVVNETCRSDH
jgi:hypothetical protein